MSKFIQLDVHDDMATVRGYLDTVPDTVIVLVAPIGTQILYNPVQLRLIRVHAEMQGKDVALVTHDRRAQTLAREAGLRVYTSVRSIRGATVEQGEMEAALAPRGVGERLWYFAQPLLPWTVATLVLSALVTGAVIFLPHAAITLAPASEVVDEALAVTASSALSFADVAELRIPARLIEVRLLSSGQAEGSGVRKDPDKSASGKLALTNRTAEPVEVPQGTKVVADNGIEFVTVGPVVVPPQPDGRAEIDVTATQPGPVGNVSTRAISRFNDTTFNRRLEVFNPSPTSGGTTKDGTFVTVDDRANLRQRLLDQMKGEAQQQVAAQRKDGEKVYNETITVRALRETFEEISPERSEDKPKVELKLEGVARALAFDEQSIKQTLIKHLDNRSGGKFTLAAANLRTQLLDAYQWNDEEVSFHVGVQTLAVPKVDKGTVQAAVAGRSIEEAQSALARIVPLAGRPTVELWPFWANRVPRFPWRISVSLSGVDQQ